MGDKACDERHDTCVKRMDSQAGDIDKIFDSKASKGTLFWTLGIFFILLIGSYGYTTTVYGKVSDVSDKVSGIATKQDMEKLKDAMIKAIKGIK